jgi:RNA polymerase primary sigma factor
MPRRIRYKRAEERTLGVAKDMAPGEAEADIETLGGAAVIHESELVEPNDVELPRPYELPSSLASYFRNIGAIDLLTPAEEIELAARILEGDESARERMITANLRLVVRIAREFEGMGVGLQDLINEGNIGLMRAVEKFDPAKGAKFSTYSAFWIKHSMRLCLSNQARTVRIPVHMIDRVSKMRKIETQYQEHEGRLPSDEEIGEELELSRHQMRVLRRAAMSQVSLDSPLDDGEDRSLRDRIADENAPKPWEDVESEVTSNLVGQLMEGLRDREVQIMRHRFGFDGEEPMTLEEIGQQFGVTRERIRQIEAVALGKMRKRLAQIDTGRWMN